LQGTIPQKLRSAWFHAAYVYTTHFFFLLSSFEGFCARIIVSIYVGEQGLGAV
jgi:hypothetical protein